VTLPAFAAERRHRAACCTAGALQHGARNAPTAIDGHLLPAARSAVNPPAVVAAVD